MKQNMDGRLIGYIILSAFIFSTMEVALKIGGTSLDPFQITFVRFLIGGLVLLPLAVTDLKKRQVTLTKSDFVYLAGLGILCICLGMIFFQLGVMNSNASTAAVVFSINPMFTMMFAHFFTEEKMNRRKLVALAISLVGLVIMINPLHMDPGNTVSGMVYTVISALSFGLYSAIGKKRIKRLGGFTQTSLGFLLGSVAMGVIVAVMGRPVLAGISSDNLLNLLYVSVIVTGFGYFFYFKAIELGGAGKASVVFFLKPVIAPVVALVVLHETIGLQIVMGVGVLLIGSYINMSDKSAAAAVKTEEEIHGNDRGNEDRSAC